MKKVILILLLVSIFAISLFAQKPLVKFIDYDGKETRYNIEDISKIDFIKQSVLSYTIEIYQGGGSVGYDLVNTKAFEFDSTHFIIRDNDGSRLTFILDQINFITFRPNECTEISIGTQTWKCSNLDVDHYRNGDSIPEISDRAEWANSKIGAWCYYNNDSETGSVYGKLYNWYAVNDSRGLAPIGWHISNNDDWNVLLDFLGGKSIAGAKIKEVGYAHWKAPNTGATNTVKFSALPAGYRNSWGTFIDLGYHTGWWLPAEYLPTHGWISTIGYDYLNLVINPTEKTDGFSVRCVKD